MRSRHEKLHDLDLAPILSPLKTFLESGKLLQRLRRLEEQGRPKS